MIAIKLFVGEGKFLCLVWKEMFYCRAFERRNIRKYLLYFFYYKLIHIRVFSSY